MTKANAKRWLPEITHWANGGTLWGRSSNGIWFKYKIFNFSSNETIVIGDKHVEARKVHALGESVEVLSSGVWLRCDQPKWITDKKYRPKKKEWYDDIPEGGTLCHYGDSILKFVGYILAKTNDRFIDEDDISWDQAVPVKPEECYQGEER